MNFVVGDQGLIHPLPTSWQEKLDSKFCAIKSIAFAILIVEVILVLLIRLRLRIAWAVVLNRVWDKLRG